MSTEFDSDKLHDAADQTRVLFEVRMFKYGPATKTYTALEQAVVQLHTIKCLRPTEPVDDVSVLAGYTKALGDGLVVIQAAMDTFRRKTGEDPEKYTHVNAQVMRNFREFKNQVALFVKKYKE